MKLGSEIISCNFQVSEHNFLALLILYSTHVPNCVTMHANKSP